MTVPERVIPAVGAAELLVPPEARRRVLLVDGDARTTKRLARMLEEDGYVMEVATDGPDALRRLDRAIPDVLVTAVVLAGGSGIKIMNRARAARPTLPVVFVTNYPELVHPIAEATPLVLVFTKPLAYDALRAALASITSRLPPGLSRTEEIARGRVVASHERMETPKKILVATDFTPTSEHAVDYALGLAKAFRAHVVLVYAYELPVLGFPTEAYLAMNVSARLDEAASVGLTAQAEAKAYMGVPIETVARMGYAPETIHEVAEEVSADLIVVGTHGRRGISRALLGSVAENIIRTASRPVLVVHTPPEEQASPGAA